SFASRVRSFAPEPLRATRKNLEAALAFVRGLRARGGTDIGSSLDEALRIAGAAEDGAVLLFITDGAPTVGITDPGKIVEGAVRLNGGDHRLHVFGVGHDVNTRLLDDLARRNGGSRTYLESAAELEVALSGLVDKVLYPCLARLQITGIGISIDRIEPAGPHDLFFGEDFILTGRYRGSGSGKIRVEGELGGERRAFLFAGDFPAHGGEEEAAYLWAQMRIFTLLDKMRSAPVTTAARLRQEITDLGLRFGIVTPYTSFLVREDDANLLSRAVRDRIARSAPLSEEVEREARGFLGATGRDAFEYSRRQTLARKRSLEKGAAGLPASPGDIDIGEELGVLRAGGRAFHIVDGRHVEGSFRGGKLPTPDRILAFGSDEYLQFLQENPGAARLLAGGRSLLFRWQEKVIQIDDRPDAVPEEPPPPPREREPKKPREYL
ncbi:MAG: hypothetical protein ACE5GW_09220, partial [Planctomycetota bacterium]